MIKIDLEKNIAFIEVAGTPIHIEIQEIIEELLRHPDHVEGMDELWDFRKASLVSFDKEKLQSLGSFVRENLPKLAKRVAYVIAGEKDYGIGRMWLGYAEIAGANQERELFKTVEDAEKWLTSPPFTLN